MDAFTVSKMRAEQALVQEERKEGEEEKGEANSAARSKSRSPIRPRKQSVFEQR
jgi:hypothetical protein